MKAKIQKFRVYLDYVERHYDNVQKAWGIIQDKCSDMRFVYDDYIFNLIDTNVKNHDLSKLSQEEFTQYRQFFFPTADEEKDRELFDLAWMNHLKQNNHHWQTWTSKEFSTPYEAEIYFIENIIDWMAMGFEFGDTAQEYYENNKSKIHLPDWSIDLMYKIFDRVYPKQ
jgi:Family of unknown function (DUF5662)